MERTKNVISLNEAERRKELNAQEALLASRISTDKGVAAGVAETIDAARDDGLQANERSIAKSLSVEKVRKDAKDIFLMEAAHILSDEMDVISTEPELAIGTSRTPLPAPH
jgi:carboxyl-terminal processing protease